MREELNAAKSRQLETEKELNATKQELNAIREMLKIGNSIPFRVFTQRSNILENLLRTNLGGVYPFCPILFIFMQFSQIIDRIIIWRF